MNTTTISTITALVALSLVTPALAQESQVGVGRYGAQFPRIRDAWRQAAGAASLGLPAGNGGGARVHRFLDGVIQDFARTDAAGVWRRSAILARSVTSPAFVVKDGACDAYFRPGMADRLGLPVANVAVRRQAFARGNLIERNGRFELDSVGVGDAGEVHLPILRAFNALEWWLPGEPTNRVHRWGPMFIQDFVSESAGGHTSVPGARFPGAILYRADTGPNAQALWLGNGVWKAYLELGGEARLGFPRGREAGNRYMFDRGTLAFVNGAWRIEAGLVGRDAAGNVVEQIFAAYGREGGQDALGQPYDNGGGAVVHRWGAGRAQDLRGGRNGTGALLLRDGSPSAYWVGGEFFALYVREGGATGRLGYPTSEIRVARVEHPGGANIEFDEVGEQRFEGGRIIYLDGELRVEYTPGLIEREGDNRQARGVAHRRRS